MRREAAAAEEECLLGLEMGVALPKQRQEAAPRINKNTNPAPLVYGSVASYTP